MRIDQYQHGEDDLWRGIGEFLCSRDVVRALGGPIYSAEGVVWFVARDGDRVIGFASLRRTPAAAWYDYAYVVPDRRGKGVFTRLAKDREKAAAKLKLPLRTLVREARWGHYEKRGWTVLSRRGSWIHTTREAP